MIHDIINKAEFAERLWESANKLEESADKASSKAIVQNTKVSKLIQEYVKQHPDTDVFVVGGKAWVVKVEDGFFTLRPGKVVTLD